MGESQLQAQITQVREAGRKKETQSIASAYQVRRWGVSDGVGRSRDSHGWEMADIPVSYLLSKWVRMESPRPGWRMTGGRAGMKGRETQYVRLRRM